MMQRRTARRISRLSLSLFLLLSSWPAIGADVPADHKQVLQSIDAHAAQFTEISRRIWEFAEVGYQETKSTALLQKALEDAGFTVQAGVAEIPTAFVATYGQGKPVIGILGEFDALPGLSQDAVPYRRILVPEAPGHACGHNLFGAGSALAAVSIKEYLERNKLPGTIRYYGTPAEEGGSGKVYMTRAGLFNDADAVLHWHPGDSNEVENGNSLAMISAKFRFHGQAAHASVSPERGRSALDAAMLMNIAVDMLREHVPSTTRIHYTISKGGASPNVVPDLAETFLYARSPSMTTLDGIWERILKCAQGAALATETKLEVQIVNSDYNILPNTPLANLIYKNFVEVGGMHYSPEERAFAEALVRNLPEGAARKLGSESTVEPVREPDPNEPTGSSDVGDVSWAVPTAGISTATWVPGTPAHSWQAVASGGGRIGQDGMILAAKVLAITAADLYVNPQVLREAKADFEKRRAGEQYRSRIPADQKPPLNYRR